MILDIYIMVLLFILGLVMGSFFSVVGTRVPKKESIIKPRSHCENCNHILKWYELIPVFSYVIQRGRCTKCKTKLSLSYPLIEILNGFLYSLSYALYGFSYEMMAFIIISSILILIFVSDFKYMIILDEPLIIGSILILGLKLYYFGFETFTKSIFSGLIMFIFMLFIKLVGDKAFKRESLGGGDIKLMFFIGLALGPWMSVFTIFLSSFIALPLSLIIYFRSKDGIIPYGLFLLIACLIIILFRIDLNMILGL